jgi:hypothetical protein
MHSDWTDELNEEEVRLTAYFLWEQEGRPNTSPDDFWERSLALHGRAHLNRLELEAGLGSQGEARGDRQVSDPHPSEEGHPYEAPHPGGAKPPHNDLGPNKAIHDGVAPNQAD